MNTTASQTEPVAWLWSVPWLAKQHRGVPLDIMQRGIAATGIQPALIIDGQQHYDGLAYAKLQEWLLIEAERQHDEEAETETSDRANEPTRDMDPCELLHQLINSTNQADRLHYGSAIATIVGTNYHPETRPGLAAFMNDLTGAVHGDADAIERCRAWVTEHLATA
ncbi:MAG: hypothetical protein AAF711_11390 [Planctomycetota bacterium]